VRFVQGDQIGRFFACLPNFIFHQFYENDINRPNSESMFATEKVRELRLTKFRLGYILGAFLQKHLVTLGLFDEYDGIKILNFVLGGLFSVIGLDKWHRLNMSANTKLIVVVKRN
jgi:hypothetical protein